MHAAAERFTAPLVVNAAGAWADEVAALAGITRVGLQPRRRTAVLVDPPPGMDVSRWPFVNDTEEQFYFKPEAGSLFLSPADETPVEPSDAQPDEWDIAAAVERIEAATTLRIARLKARWAGLRTFAPDRTPVVGVFGRGIGLLLARGSGRLRDPDRARPLARRSGAHHGSPASRGLAKASSAELAARFAASALARTPWVISYGAPGPLTD